jgi:hypothetical protein
LGQKGEKLSRKQEDAIVALLTAPTIQAAAEATGITYITLWRWMQIPEFKEQYREARLEAVRQAVSRLSQIGSEAVDVLRDIMNDQEAPASSRVTAAKSILEGAFKGIELDDLAARIEALEKTLEERGKT